MISFTFWTAVLSLAFAYAQSVTSMAINSPRFDGLNQQAREILARATPAAPHFVVYSDAWDGTTGPPAVAQIKVNFYDIRSNKSLRSRQSGI